MACTCVSCGMCGGSGTVWFDLGGKYLGNHRCDDLDVFESCEECGGRGTVEICDECQDALEAENDAN